MLSQPAHLLTRGQIAGRTAKLTTHSLAETYSVLTRLPGDARMKPADPAALLAAISRTRSHRAWTSAATLPSSWHQSASRAEPCMTRWLARRNRRRAWSSSPGMPEPFRRTRRSAPPLKSPAGTPPWASRLTHRRSDPTRNAGQTVVFTNAGPNSAWSDCPALTALRARQPPRPRGTAPSGSGRRRHLDRSSATGRPLEDPAGIR